MLSPEFREEVRRDVERLNRPQALREPIARGLLRPGARVTTSAAIEDATRAGTADYAPDAAGLDEQTLLERYRQHAGPIDLEGERYYLVEGDLLLDEEELEIYVRQQTALLRQVRARTEAQALGYGQFEAPDPVALVGMAIGGRIVRWKAGLVLTYSVRRETFLSPEHYDEACANMAQATQDWADVCGVQFSHLSQFDDDGAPNDQVLFTVREIDAQGEFIASAFFPTDPPGRRTVLIDHTYYMAEPESFDRVGVLRHELGHVLGFRHEHSRTGAPPECERESAIYGPTTATPLTTYDPKSVMHYLCGGAGSRELRLTELDIAGAQRIYGPPVSGVRDIDF